MKIAKHMIGWRPTDIPSNASYPHSQDANHCFGVKSWSWLACWVRVRIPGIFWCNNKIQLCFVPLFKKSPIHRGSNRLTTKTDSAKNTASSGILHTKKLSNLSAPSHGGTSWRESSKSVKLQSGGKKIEIINTSKKQHHNLLITRSQLTDEWYDSQKYCLHA